MLNDENEKIKIVLDKKSKAIFLNWLVRPIKKKQIYDINITKQNERKSLEKVAIK